MPPISVYRAFLLCLIALIVCSISSRAENTDPKNGKPGQFTNGQNGTPNLPIPPSMIVDKNNMRGGYGRNQDSTRHEIKRRRNFLRDLYPAAQRIVDDLARVPLPPERVIAADYTALSQLIEKELEAINRDDAEIRLPEQYLYAGIEARGGTDKPVFGPEVTYGDSRSGLELGLAGYFQSPSSDGLSRRDSVGVSLKYIVQSLAARSMNQYEPVRQVLLKIDALDLDPSPKHVLPTTVQSLSEIDRDKQRSRAGKVAQIQNALGIAPSNPGLLQALPGMAPEAVTHRLEILIQDLDAETAPALENYAQGTRDLAAAFVVGDQHFSGGGDVFNAGATVSRLIPFGIGAPGVTAVAVGQYFQDNLGDSPHRSAARLGLAAIYQDTTLKVVTQPADPKDPSAGLTKELGPPWHYKIGIEYAAPVFSLHETGAVFARYRWNPSYWEVTAAYGKDGLRKDYVDVSLGKSFTF